MAEQQTIHHQEEYKPTPMEEKLHELIKKYGPKETTYCTEFSTEDILKIQKLSQKIHDMNKMQLENPLAKYFLDVNERKWNDHSNTFLDIGNGEKAELIAVAKTDDIPTIQGLAWCCKIIVRAGFLSWRYIYPGSQQREGRAYQQELFGEVGPRMDMTVPAQGSVSRSSQTLIFTGIFPASHATVTVRESAVSNAAAAGTGTNLNRNSFPDFAISHVAGVSGFTLATAITFTPVTTWG